MKNLIDVSIRILMTDVMGNGKTLDVKNDRFGVLEYNLYSTRGRQRECLSNMQLTERLPDVVEEFRSLNHLTLGICRILNTGVQKVDSVAFSRSLPRGTK
jgi:hypothetical protein